MRVLVTGANGFIGSHVCRALLQGGHRVRGLIQPDTPLDNLRGLDLKTRLGDVRDRARLRQACAGQQAVVHLAAIPSDWAPRRLIHAVNVGGTRNLVGAALDAGCRRLVLMSSLAVHDSTGHRDAREDTPRDRANLPYADSKRRAEDLVLDPRLQGRLEGVVLRPGLVPFGPRDRLFSLNLCRVIQGGWLPLIRGGRAVVCTGYAENLADGVKRAVEVDQAAYETLVISDEGAPSWAELFEAFARSLGARPRRPSLPWAPVHGLAAALEATWGLARRSQAPPLTRYRVDLMRHDFHFSHQRARRVLGYVPRIDLQEAVARTVRWVRGTAVGGA